MRAITLGYDSAGRAVLIHGPEVKPSDQKQTRLAAREGKARKGIVRLETYTIAVENKLGASVVAAPEPATEKAAAESAE
jgi:NAD+--asparagine ADP-ribosyltransferase